MTAHNGNHGRPEDAEQDAHPVSREAGRGIRAGRGGPGVSLIARYAGPPPACISSWSRGRQDDAGLMPLARAAAAHRLPPADSGALAFPIGMSYLLKGPR